MSSIIFAFFLKFFSKLFVKPIDNIYGCYCIIKGEMRVENRTKKGKKEDCAMKKKKSTVGGIVSALLALLVFMLRPLFAPGGGGTGDGEAGLWLRGTVY